MKFKIKYSFSRLAVKYIETDYFRIFTQLSSAVTDGQLVPWLEYPPEQQFYELNVQDDDLRVDIGRADSVYSGDSFDIELIFHNWSCQPPKLYRCPI